MSTQQGDLGDFGSGTEAVDVKQRWGITQREFERRHRSTPKPTGERESECEHCGNRVTKTISMGTVGHNPGWGADKDPCPKYTRGED